MTPEQVHYGKAQDIFDFRSQVLVEAFQKNPLRFKGKLPKPIALPGAARINKAKTEQIGA